MIKKTFKLTKAETDVELMEREKKLDHVSGRMVWLCFAVALGNGGLMALLAFHPLPVAMAQLMAGYTAIALHGWGAWEIASVLRQWSASSGYLAEQAADTVCLAARAQVKKGYKTKPSN